MLPWASNVRVVVWSSGSVVVSLVVVFIVGAARDAAQRVDRRQDIAPGVVFVGRRIAALVSDRLAGIGDVIDEVNFVAGRVEPAEHAAVGVILDTHTSAAERIDDLFEKVRVRRAVVEARRIARAVGHADKVALGIVLIMHRSTARIGD